PPPRPPQSTIPQLTSLLINNAGALALAPRSLFVLHMGKQTLSGNWRHDDVTMQHVPIAIVCLGIDSDTRCTRSYSRLFRGTSRRGPARADVSLK
ncbi:hypothetical protein OSH66_21740, partial [Mycobacterium ulcerans]|nr:hypothetical protein [Mycobacterium ulcerans]MEB4058150.1 hypothetical protein [Mycobacterium ulcerans]MEB4070578.1 hypothetical protein [Mycobacterium ulcerans]MEB4124325.1 hypothetical protein [Mycobacterium ulcerans]MEB4161589.1 hypothetical protein [Mycobacterium ulcerans]